MDPWSYRSDIDVGGADVIGWKVYAVDEHVGEVTEENSAVGDAHLVVDIGSWLRDKRRLIPAGAVARVDTQAERLYLDMTRDDIEAAPEFVSESVLDGDDQYRNDVGTYFIPWITPSR
jgi:hypothetical protein